MYFIIPHMYFRVNLRMKKLTLCCSFTWIVFIKLNFTVALLLIRKTWMTDLPVTSFAPSLFLLGWLKLNLTLLLDQLRDECGW